MIKRRRLPGVWVRGVRAFIQMLDKDGGSVPREFDNYRDAAEYYGCTEAQLRGRLNTVHDDVWYVYLDGPLWEYDK